MGVGQGPVLWVLPTYEQPNTPEKFTLDTPLAGGNEYARASKHLVVLYCRIHDTKSAVLLEYSPCKSQISTEKKNDPLRSRTKLCPIFPFSFRLHFYLNLNDILPVHFWKACENPEVWKSNSSVLNLLDIPSVEDLLGILSVADTL